MIRVVPALLVGAVAVGAAELSLSLLLYAQPGFVRALTVLLAVQLASLAVGLAVAPRRDAEGRWTVRAALDLRRRWLLAVGALGVSAVAAGGWSLLGGLGGTGMQRGVAAAALASLPQLTLGGVLGGLASRSPRGRIGAWAAFGGAVGAVALGSGLGTRLLPTSLLLAGTVLVSVAALLDGRVDREARAADPPETARPDGGPTPVATAGPAEDAPRVGAVAPEVPAASVAPLAPEAGVTSVETLAPGDPVTSVAILAPDDADEVIDVEALAPDEGFDVVPVGALAPDDGIPVEFLAPDPA